MTGGAVLGLLLSIGLLVAPAAWQLAVLPLSTTILAATAGGIGLLATLVGALRMRGLAADLEARRGRPAALLEGWRRLARLLALALAACGFGLLFVPAALAWAYLPGWPALALTVTALTAGGAALAAALTPIEAPAAALALDLSPARAKAPLRLLGWRRFMAVALDAPARGAFAEEIDRQERAPGQRLLERIFAVLDRGRVQQDRRWVSWRPDGAALAVLEARLRVPALALLFALCLLPGAVMALLSGDRELTRLARAAVQPPPLPIPAPSVPAPPPANTAGAGTRTARAETTTRIQPMPPPLNPSQPQPRGSEPVQTQRTEPAQTQDAKRPVDKADNDIATAALDESDPLKENRQRDLGSGEGGDSSDAEEQDVSADEPEPKGGPMQLRPARPGEKGAVRVQAQGKDGQAAPMDGQQDSGSGGGQPGQPGSGQQGAGQENGAGGQDGQQADGSGQQPGQGQGTTPGQGNGGAGSGDMVFDDSPEGDDGSGSGGQPGDGAGEGQAGGEGEGQGQGQGQGESQSAGNGTGEGEDGGPGGGAGSGPEGRGQAGDLKPGDGKERVADGQLPGWGLTGSPELADAGAAIEAPESTAPPTNIVILHGAKDLAQSSGSSRPSNAPSVRHPSNRDVSGGAAEPSALDSVAEGSLPAGTADAIQPLPAWSVRRLPTAP